VRRDERGFTLIELLLVCFLSIIILGVPLTMATQSVITQNQASSRSAATNRLESGGGGVPPDLRQAADPTTVSSTGAVLTMPVRTTAGSGTPATQLVTWACTNGGSCTRKIGSGTAVTVISNVVSATFTASAASDPAYVSVTISVVDATEHGTQHTQAVKRLNGVGASSNAISVTDGVALRNFAL
jgi:Tfp pilus assembly protein PilV